MSHMCQARRGRREGAVMGRQKNAESEYVCLGPTGALSRRHRFCFSNKPFLHRDPATLLQ